MNESPFDEVRNRVAVDLADRVYDIRDDLIPELEERIERREEFDSLRNDPDESIDDPDAWPDESVADLTRVRDTRQGEADAHERTIKALCPEHSFDPSVNDEHPCPGVDCEHAETEFVIQELFTTETAQLTDDVSEESMDIDVERQNVDANIRQGYHKVRLIQLAIIDAPGEMPRERDPELPRGYVYDVGDMPDHTSDYLYLCATELNDVGPEAVDDVGNLESYGVEVGETTDDSPADES